MNLRKLELKDAELMMEWMHDPFVVEDLQTDFASKTLQDCENFINAAQEGTKDIHLAIVNDEDKYMGTVSLKHIEKDSAEFAITVCKAAMGKGYSKYAMSEIIRIGFEELNLQSIYWCVSPENKRAVRFYDKNGYQRIDADSLIIKGYTDSQIASYIWYFKLREDNVNNTNVKVNEALSKKSFPNKENIIVEQK
jgi:diamine N-acetyltransferase